MVNNNRPTIKSQECFEKIFGQATCVYVKHGITKQIICYLFHSHIDNEALCQIIDVVAELARALRAGHRRKSA
jgi:hypothetical protein